MKEEARLLGGERSATCRALYTAFWGQNRPMEKPGGKHLARVINKPACRQGGVVQIQVLWRHNILNPS